VRGLSDDTTKAAKVFRPTTKTGDFAHNLCNQLWAGFWSHDGQLLNDPVYGRVADDSSSLHLYLPANPFAVRISVQCQDRSQGIHLVLLNLHSGVGSEFLLAFDASLTCCLEFRRVPNFIE
jgi:hypothetical protein